MYTEHTPSAGMDGLVAPLWSSLIFAEGSLRKAAPETRTTINQVFRQSRSALLEVVALIWPGLDEAARLALVDQLAPKSVAVCGTLAAEETADVARLSAAAVAVGLVDLATQTLHRGDTALGLSIEQFIGETDPARPACAPEEPTGCYLPLIEALVEQVVVMARPEDRFDLLHLLLTDTLVREARIARLNRKYLHLQPDSFWPRYAGEAADLIVLNGGFVAVAAAIYSVLRHERPDLPSLSMILGSSPQVDAALRAGNAACRIFDDVGNRAIDMGATGWGTFALNPCNQRDPRFLQALLTAMGMTATWERNELLQAFEHESFDEVLSLATTFARRQFAAIPASLRKSFGLFLSLNQRVLDIGRFNMISAGQLFEATQVRAVGQERPTAV